MGSASVQAAKFMTPKFHLQSRQTSSVNMITITCLKMCSFFKAVRKKKEVNDKVNAGIRLMLENAELWIYMYSFEFKSVICINISTHRKQ